MTGHNSKGLFDVTELEGFKKNTGNNASFIKLSYDFMFSKVCLIYKISIRKEEGDCIFLMFPRHVHVQLYKCCDSFTYN